MRKEHGFTLIEVLITMAISGILMAAIYYSYVSQQRSYAMTQQLSKVQQNLRTAMYHLERDLKTAGYDPMGDGLHGFVEISGITVSFTRGTFTSGVSETVSYRHNHAQHTLERNINHGGYNDVSENITLIRFVYLDMNGNITPVMADVRAVDITLIGSDGGHTRQLQTLVRCRNMGLL